MVKVGPHLYHDRIYGSLTFGITAEHRLISIV
jgi:hypothetical protein